MTLEICANSYQSAVNAQESGADRIELCSELSLGGITPSFGLIDKVMSALKIPVFVLIRPRSGNFNYSEDEFEIMKKDIESCKKTGCHGIVSGVLNSDNSLDLERTKELIELSKPLSFTFHRAFDCVPNPTQALEQLIKLGTDRILTSGQENTAEKGLKLLRKLNEISRNRIIILPGSGINADNVNQFREAGFNEIHSSASKNLDENSESTPFDKTQTESNCDIIKSMLKKIKDEV